MVQSEMASFVGLQPMEPHEALEWLIARERSMIDFYERRIAEMHPDDVQGPVVTSRPMKGEYGMDLQERAEEHGPPAAHIWIKLRNEAAERLAKWAKAAADVNVDERRVRIDEAKLEAVAGVLNATIRDLVTAGLSPGLRALGGESFRRHAAQLTVVSGTARELAA